MMRRELSIYAMILLVSLGLAYWASLPSSEADKDKITVSSIDPQAVKEIHYLTPELDVSLRRQADSYWVDWQKTEKPSDKPAADKSPHAKLGETKPLDKVEPKVTRERFLANDKVKELLAGFAPLQALRIIGKVDADKLEEYGLKDKSSRISLQAGEQTLAYTIGKKSYGSRNRFVLEESGERRVILIDDQGLESLERADTRLYERRIVGVEFDDVSHVQVDAAGKKQRLAHTQRDKNGELVWSEEQENAPAKPSYSSWMDKINKLRLSGFVDVDKEAQVAAIPAFLELTLEKNGKPLDKLVFRKAPASAAGPVEYFVTSGLLKTHAKILANRMEPIEKDIGTIMGGK